MADRAALLVVLAGLPGTGKTTLAREMAGRIGAMHLRVDSIEAALHSSSLAIHPAEDAGYLVALALARDNLAVGLDVIADAVNPIPECREWWIRTAGRARARLLTVELSCGDVALHQTRIESRRADLPGLVVPDWDAVLHRPYHPWSDADLHIDTAARPIHESLDTILTAARTARRYP